MPKHFRLLPFVLFIFAFSSCEKQDSQAMQQEKQEKILENHIKSQEEETSEFTPLPVSYSYEDLDSFVGSKVSLEGRLTGEKFQHEVFFHPPYSEMAHFNLSAAYQFIDKMPHIVIYFKKGSAMEDIFTRFLDQDAVISGVLGKVDGSLQNPDPAEVKNRRAHTEYFLDVEKIQGLE